MVKLCYNLNGLRKLSLLDALTTVASYGYGAVELSVHPNHINPTIVTPLQITKIKKAIQTLKVDIVSLATGADTVLSDIPHYPSLVTCDNKQRTKRVNFIKASIKLAKALSIPIVSFNSGIIQNTENTRKFARERLIDGINECLSEADDIILAIEPEPNFFIESSHQAITLIDDIGHDNLKLNLDIGHVNCIEDNYYQSIKQAVPYTAHIHIEDIKDRVHHHLIPGDGDINFIKTLEHLAGYDGYISIELYTESNNYHNALQRSYNFFSPLLTRK